jgi:phosphatidylglycerophosphatase GEP4
MMNVSATVNVLRLLANPSLCLPHHTIATFDQLPVPLSTAFASRYGEKKPDIRAVVLDKDNCFSVPKRNEVYAPYQSKFDELRQAYPGSKLLIVSNSSGTGSDKGHVEADLLERNTGVKVLRHSTKKPGCHAEIMEYFRNAQDTEVTHESQVAIVGDRLFTDMLMANMMGSYGIWIQKGTVEDNGLVSGIVVWIESTLAHLIVAHACRTAGLEFPAPKRLFTSAASEPFRVNGMSYDLLEVFN